MLLDGGTDGEWAARELSDALLAAPSLMPFEVANIIRRHAVAGLVGADQAVQAHGDLLDLAIELWPYEGLARRAWELRANLSIYDGSYVALAEGTDSVLVTLDRRIATASGVRCPVSAPP
jgi:predicted nucleic acid-binding protein